MAEILKAIRLQKAQQPVTLKKHDANQFAIDTSKRASASGRCGHEFATLNFGGTVRSTVGQPQAHLPVTRAWSSWGRSMTPSGGANSRRRRSASLLSSADKGLSC